MAPPQSHRINKSSHRHSGNFGPTPIKTKINVFAHTHFSPTDPTRSPKDREAAWLQVEKLDSPTLMAASINKEADTWECQDCSWKVRMLADKLNSNFHTEASATPTSHPAPGVHSSDNGYMELDSPATSPNDIAVHPKSYISRNIENLRRETLNRDAGDRQPFYGVHQALFDLSRGESVTVHMRDSDQVFSKYDLKPGTIISAPFHSQYRNDIISTLDHNTGVSAFGPVYSKYRKMVIIENWSEHVVCLPIYTYNGKGLERRQDMINEYMDIRDVEDEYPTPGDIRDEEPLLAVRNDKWIGRNTFIAGRAVVKLTERTTHMLYQKCSVEGKLEPAHFQRMYVALNKLTQAKTLEVFGKPIESMVIMP